VYEEQNYDVILQRMLGRVSDKLDKRPSSLIFDTHSSTAVELQNLYIELEYLILNSYGDTAAREFLILLCKERGITPELATNAVLKGEFTPTTIDLTGQKFNIGDLNYVVTEQIVPGQYQVKCETVGIIGNQYLGDMIPMEYIDGLKTATLTELLIPGEDEEDTEVLRKQYFDSFNEQSFGGNRADYLAKVRSIDGVGDAKVTRVWNDDLRPADMIPSEKVTAWYDSVISTLDAEVAIWLSSVYMASYERKLTVGGTVLLTVVNSEFGEVSTVLLDNIQTIIDPVQNAGEGYGLAPIGHVVNVKSAEPVTVDVKATITVETGFSWSNLQSSIDTAVSNYLLELRKTWTDTEYLIVRISQIETRLLGVKGIIDVSNTKINNSADNLSLTKFQIPIMGGVSA